MPLRLLSARTGEPLLMDAETIARFQVQNRVEVLLRRMQDGWSNIDDMLINEVEQRLANIAIEIGSTQVERIVADVEAEYRQHIGDKAWQILLSGTPEEWTDHAQEFGLVRRSIGETPGSCWLEMPVRCWGDPRAMQWQGGDAGDMPSRSIMRISGGFVWFTELFPTEEDSSIEYREVGGFCRTLWEAIRKSDEAAKESQGPSTVWTRPTETSQVEC